MTGGNTPADVAAQLDELIAAGDDPTAWLQAITFRNRAELAALSGIPASRFAAFSRGKKPTRMERSAMLWMIVYHRWRAISWTT